MGRWAGRILVAVLVVVTSVTAEVATASENHPTRLPITIGHDTPSGSVVVKPGDHLWKISARHLSEVRNETATNSEISPYWRRVVEENTPNLRSGDPDLIYPGEVIDLPSVIERR